MCINSGLQPHRSKIFFRAADDTPPVCQNVPKMAEYLKKNRMKGIMQQSSCIPRKPKACSGIGKRAAGKADGLRVRWLSRKISFCGKEQKGN